MIPRRVTTCRCVTTCRLLTVVSLHLWACSLAESALPSSEGPMGGEGAVPSSSSTQASKWPWPHRGDVRAVVTVPKSLAGQELAVGIVWRRHDHRPEEKRVIVTDNTDAVLSNVSIPVVTQHHGVVTFTPSADGNNLTYYIYWLPYTQTGIGAGLHFEWDKANAQNYVTIGSFRAASANSSAQTYPLPATHQGSRLRWRCTKTLSGFQPFLRELRIGVAQDGRPEPEWLQNTATAADPLPVDGWSGQQPSGDPGNNGAAWRAMDGDEATFWDATSEAASLDILLPRMHNITAVQVVNYGDSTHDCVAFDIQVPEVSPGNSSRPWQQLPAVPPSAIVIEARNDFESFAPMELATNSTETAALVASRSGVGGVPPPYLLFHEPRERPVRMLDRIPLHWATSAPLLPNVSAGVVRGEFFTWQLAVYVPTGADRLESVALTFAGFDGLPATPTCFNLGGVSPEGEVFSTTVTVEEDRVRSLWVGVQIPATLPVGTTVRGTMAFSARHVNTTSVPVTLSVMDEPVQTAEPEPNKMTRLRWLDSTLYTHDYGLVPPYTAIKRVGDTLAILNRRISVGNSTDESLGLPAQVNVTRPASRHGTLAAKTIPLLSGPTQLLLVDPEGRPLSPSNATVCQATKPQHTHHGDGLVSWRVNSAATTEGGESTVCVAVNISLGMEGLMVARVSLHSPSGSSGAVPLSDIRLKLSLAAQHGLSWMGLATRGQHGNEAGGLSLSKGNVSWTWKTPGKSYQLFVGSANAGLKVKLRGNTTEWESPIERIYDGSELLPDEWGANNGLGGINASARPDGGVDIVLYTGPQRIGTNSSSSSRGRYTLNFDMTVTPFKTPNETQHWNLRHYQVG